MNNTAPALTRWELICFGKNRVLEEEITLFRDCIESLLGQKEEGGFRGVQSKSLVDLIQLECLSQSSSVLKITKAGDKETFGSTTDKVIDAATLTMGGESAFKEILSWKTGSFEILPGEPDHPRTISDPVSGTPFRFRPGL